MPLHVNDRYGDDRNWDSRQRPNVAVIGAGISGLLAARLLADQGLPVTVFEKSRGVGGRMATRRWEDGSSFDHGAQYFTARDDRFARYVASWQQQGFVAPWPAGDRKIVALNNGREFEIPSAVVRYVGVPGMTAIAQHLAQSLRVRFETRIVQLSASHLHGYELRDESGTLMGEFQRIIVALPAPQAAELLVELPEMASLAGQVELQPCWAGLARFSKPFQVNWAGAFLHNSPLSWTCRNGTKPGRPVGHETVVIHASPNWSRKHLDRAPAEVAALMLKEFWPATGLPKQVPMAMEAHRWRYSIPATPLQCGTVCNSDSSVIACGDWCHGARVEGAFLSGLSASLRVLDSCRQTGNNTEAR